MTYATLRLVEMGHRVIKIEPTPLPGQNSKGDPNRFVGKPFVGEDRYSYFIPTNVGKESIALNLKEEKGKEILYQLVDKLGADIFCTNTMPARHEQLGFDYKTLKDIKNDLIWCSISAMGLEYPKVPGYDPILQALCGYMDLTGHIDGPPLACGIPLIDLKAGDEAFTQIILALLERLETGNGSMIDISMAHAAISWLHTFLPMLDMGSFPSELKRSGNDHRQFVPANTYQCADGFIYIAIGSDAQWNRFIKTPMFASLNQECYATNEVRRKNRELLHTGINTVMSQHSSEDISKTLTQTGIPHSPITPIEEVANLPFVTSSLLQTNTPDGRTVHLPPPAAKTSFLNQKKEPIPFAPAYGESTDAILNEVGISTGEISSFREQGIVA